MFSETVDRCVEALKRPDQLLNIIDYTNGVLRELHSEHNFRDDDRELRLEPPNGGFSQAVPPAQFFGATPAQFGGWLNSGGGYTPDYTGGGLHSAIAGTRANTHVWAHPRTFKKMEAVRYDGHCYVPYKRPSRQQKEYCDYYYTVGGNHIFVGWHRYIDLYFKVYPPHFKYYTPDQRPAIFDRSTGAFVYKALAGPYVPSLSTTTQMQAAQDLVYAWMLDRWQELVIHGVSRRVCGNLQDDRLGYHTQEYEKLKLRMIAAEAEYAQQVT